MIKLSNITKSFADKRVFNNLNIAFHENEINVIYGPSGCGKTTLFNIISGIDKNFSGNISGIPNDIAYLFQEDRLLPYYNVIDNIMFTLPDTMKESERKTRAQSYLDIMEMPTEKDTLPHELSGGMARRVAIARALSYPSTIMLMDEPFNGLNALLKTKVYEAILRSNKKDNKTVIIITHDLSVFEKDDAINFINLSNYID